MPARSLRTTSSSFSACVWTLLEVDVESGEIFMLRARVDPGGLGFFAMAADAVTMSSRSRSAAASSTGATPAGATGVTAADGDGGVDREAGGAGAGPARTIHGTGKSNEASKYDAVHLMTEYQN